MAVTPDPRLSGLQPTAPKPAQPEGAVRPAPGLPPGAAWLIPLGPVIPVLVIDRESDAVPLAEALVAGGVRVLEVTLRTQAALPAIAAIARQVPDAVVGAGTVINAADVRRVHEAGARFAVSPGCSDGLLAACAQHAMPLLPGAVTASEVMRALDAGLDFLKFFPATAAGGLPLLKALHGPFAQVRFCPTGGLTLETAPSYLALPNVPVCGGSWLTPADALAAGDWARITGLAQQSAALRTTPRA